MRRFLLAFCFAVGACVGGDFSEVFITDASLTIDMKTAMVILGGSGGQGVLTFTQVGGATGSCNVSMRGPMIGAIFMVAGGTSTFDFSLPEESVPLDDLFGVYHGTAAGIGLILAGENHTGTNGSGVSFDDGNIIGGAGMYLGLELLRLRPPALADCTF